MIITLTWVIYHQKFMFNHIRLVHLLGNLIETICFLYYEFFNFLFFFLHIYKYTLKSEYWNWYFLLIWTYRPRQRVQINIDFLSKCIGEYFKYPLSHLLTPQTIQLFPFLFSIIIIRIIFFFSSCCLLLSTSEPLLTPLIRIFIIQ